MKIDRDDRPNCRRKPGVRAQVIARASQERLGLYISFVAAICAASTTAAYAQRDANSGDWPLEELSLRTGGRVLRGLIESERPGSVEFVEVVRNDGQRPYVVIRAIAPHEIAHRRRLPDEQRKKLIERVDRIRNRARVLRREIDAVSLRRDEAGHWDYQGPWFLFTSTADERTTRRAIVRLEQMFAAFRQVLRPQHTAPKRPLRILFFGSQLEYRAFLAAEGLRIDNPAFYSPKQNVVAAGSELAAVAAEIAAAEARHRAVLADHRKAADAQRAKLKEALKKRKEFGWSDDYCRELAQSTQRRLRNELEVVRRQILAANRRQETRFDKQTKRLFSRLYHEAFHAYVENFVFESTRYAVPVWLNEGLAQLFESARVDVDELRLDAIDAERLTALRVELHREGALGLRDVLHADREAFLVQHRAKGTSQRHYLAAWAVAYYLTHERNLLSSGRLGDYVAVDKKRSSEDRTRRFERLVGGKLDPFERDWRRHMLSLPVDKDP